MTTVKRTASTAFYDDIVNSKKAKTDPAKPPLPKELTKLFQPLFCALCSSELTSPLTAASHYAGKLHQKKIKQHLSQNFPELQPKEEESEEKANKPKIIVTSLTQDQASMCKMCNVVFPGPIAAQSHYSGKKHRNKALKGFAPIEHVPGMDAGVDTSGRFGIGESFRKPEVKELDVRIEPARSVHKWYCDICSIQTTDNEQYKTHLSGKKHRKNVAKMNLTNLVPALCPYCFQEMPSKDSILASEIKSKQKETVPALCPNCFQENPPKDSILASVIQSKEEDKNHSTSRTPSGEYYCDICDLIVNSQSQLTAHVESKKHKKKQAALSVANENVTKE